MSLVIRTALPSERECTTVALPPPGTLIVCRLESGASITWAATDGCPGWLRSQGCQAVTPTPAARTTAATAAATSRGNRRALPADDLLRRGLRGQRPDGRDLGEHLRPQVGTGAGVHGVGEHRRGLAEAGDLGGAVGALGQVALEAGALDVVEGVDGVRTGQRMHVAHESTPNVSRSRMSPSRIRVLAVPSGMPSMVDTSLWV